MATTSATPERRPAETPVEPDSVNTTASEMVDRVANDTASEVALEAAAVLGGGIIIVEPPVVESPDEKKVPGI